ncbi:winged helix-turn-helix domain-containing protein [Acanthopleuribacter pedis]|uniref:Winged helix-turn-helix domain-containing protein n=1 Tax=Acanthopleuribacter pedis TaxID=442870 RepID=A0A8J7QNS2_9BACT|nr:winged helix-turn-helix domain-containing protein [Acanthopleuribacter pedis]MBO1321385.1 winged helix-turn-helix domain-containing protein [Acanthopleuribacter pedis]
MSTPFQFGERTFDPESHLLTGPDAPQKLRYKLGALLTLLLENRERVVTQDEIRNTLWHHEHVVDHALRQTVSELRKLLGDAPKQPRFIKTVPGQGYRWIHPTRVATPEPEQPERGAPKQTPAAQPGPVTKKPAHRRLLLAAGAALPALALLLAVFFGRAEYLAVEPRDAVRAADSSAMIHGNGSDHFALTRPGEVAFHNLATQTRFRFLTPDQTMVAAIYQPQHKRYLLADGTRLTVLAEDGRVLQRKSARIIRFHPGGGQPLVNLRTVNGGIALHAFDAENLEPIAPALTVQSAPIWATTVGETVYFTTEQGDTLWRIRDGNTEAWLDLTRARPNQGARKTGLYAHGETLILAVQGPHSEVGSLLQIHLIDSRTGRLHANRFVAADQLFAGVRPGEIITFQTQHIENQVLYRLKASALTPLQPTR